LRTDRSAVRLLGLLPLATLAALTALAAAWPELGRAGVRPRAGGELLVALPATPRRLDPALATSAADQIAARAVHATLLEVDAWGGLRPGLLAALPEAEPGGRAFRCRLRPGLRFHDGSPLGAAEVAASLARLLQPTTRSPHAWVALPIEGAEAVRTGRAGALSGVQVLSPTELRIALAVPFPDFPRVLAALPSAVVPRSGGGRIGAGPFQVAQPSADLPARPGAGAAAQGALRVVPFDGHWRGRPYLDALSLVGLDAREAARTFGRGEVLVAIRPEPMPQAAMLELPALSATYASVNRARLAGRAEPVRRALAAINRVELVRLFVRGPAAPLHGLLPAAALGGGQTPPSPPAPPPSGDAGRLTLLVSSDAPFHRAVADRLQVKLFDRGVKVAVEAVPAEVFAVRAQRKDYDLALLEVPLQTVTPAAAALQAAFALDGPATALESLAALGTADRGALPAHLASLEERLDAVPLFAAALRVSARPGAVQGLLPGADGGIDFGDVWLLSQRSGNGAP
jgi:peptide/nickel transport system substrate-binding protein